MAEQYKQVPIDYYNVNLLLDFHIGLTISYSIMKITALMITAARAALGMKKKYGVNKLNDKIMRIPAILEKMWLMNSFGIILHFMGFLPVYIPPIGVRTPLA